MLDGFEEKWKRWIKPQPKECTPIQAAAAVMSVRKQVEKENWAFDKEQFREQVLNSCDALLRILYYSDADSNRIDSSKLREKEIRFIIENGGDPSSPTMPIRLAKQFLKVSTPQKREFLKRAERLSANQKFSLDDMEERLFGVYQQRRFAEPGRVNIMLNQIKHIVTDLKVSNNELIQRYVGGEVTTPQDGPRSAFELALVCMIYMEQSLWTRNNRLRAGVNPEINEKTSTAIKSLLELLYEMCDDVDGGAFRNEFYKKIDGVLNEIGMTHLITAPQVSGFTHFYVSHCAEKIPAQFLARLQAAHIDISMGVEKDKIKELGYDFSEIDYDEFIRANPAHCQRIFDFDYQRYKRPVADDVITQLELAIEVQEKGKQQKAQRRKKELMAALSDKPDLMEEVVLLHYEESDFVRDLRKKMFGPEKKSFLKMVAVENGQELSALGLSHAEITKMKEDGKIPDGSDLTIEHIIDRHHGGTNHVHNFIVLPREINRQKDELKNKQLRAYGEDAAKGCWIISWVPKKREDGTYPRVWPVQAREDLAALAQMEASAPNPLQL